VFEYFRANSDSAIHSSTMVTHVPQHYPPLNSSPSPTSVSSDRTGDCCFCD